MGYKVKLDIFEGPFDLLVYLIEHARMSIYDIRISEITTQYLEYVAKLKAADIELAEEFMVLAAELIELKSRMLLPRSKDPSCEEEEDPRKALVSRILEYKQYKESAGLLGECYDENLLIHTKPSEDLSVYEDAPDELLKTDESQFVSAFKAFLFRKQRVAEMHRVYDRIERRRMSLETKAEEIREWFKNKSILSFSELTKKDSSIFNKVITFTTLLQLIKDRSIKADQEKRFGDIRLSLIENDNKAATIEAAGEAG